MNDSKCRKLEDAMDAAENLGQAGPTGADVAEMFDLIAEAEGVTVDDALDASAAETARETDGMTPLRTLLLQERAACHKSIYHQVSGLPCCPGVRKELRQMELIDIQIGEYL